MKVIDEVRKQRSAVFVALLLFELILLLLQLWLFVSAVDSLERGSRDIGIPAMVASFVCCAINTWMLVGVVRLDRGE